MTDNSWQVVISVVSYDELQKLAMLCLQKLNL